MAVKAIDFGARRFLLCSLRALELLLLRVMNLCKL